MVFEPRGKAAGKLHEQVLQIYRGFYSFRSILRRLPANRLWRWWIMANLLYRRAVLKRWSPTF
jgi:hypothetical protein